MKLFVILVTFHIVLYAPLRGLSQEYPGDTIGGIQYILAFPDGYVDLCESDEDAAAAFLASVSPDNQLLGCYTTPQDYTEWVEGTGGVFSSYLIATVMKGTINPGVSEKSFTSFKQQMKNTVNVLYERLRPEIQEQINAATASIAENYNIDASTSINEILPIGIFDENSNHISAAWIANATHDVNGTIVQDRQIQISSSIYSKGKVFVLFTYGEYTNTSDIEKYKNIARMWTGKFLEAND